MRRPPPDGPPPRHHHFLHHGPPPPPPPRFGPPGRGGRARRGEVRLVFLEVLRDGPKHGYEIIRNLEERSGGRYVPSPGSVYPTLQYLEEAGWIAAEAQGERRVYHLTEEGKARLDSHQGDLEGFWDRYGQPEFSTSGRHEMVFLHQELHDLERTVLEGARILMGAGQEDSLRSLRKALESCKNHARDIITGRKPEEETP
ncbi:MAG: helix-turn-helix transcriptional regulator [Candidatus Eremiobacteraeota bacterium]|nr:helix-turn-helix transcriptional regulator [Candidatus Eremiobacteraeota bacterium]MCW5866859.1 helix-turn-helix transcriptional regulator [Candidatus Eremiobacteraeota bacterium]